MCKGLGQDWSGPCTVTFKIYCTLWNQTLYTASLTWSSKQLHYQKEAKWLVKSIFFSWLTRHVSICLNWTHICGRTRCTAVGIATVYRLDYRDIVVRVPVWLRIFTSPYRPDGLWGSPSLLSSLYWGFSPRVEQWGVKLATHKLVPR
jgi:hypothetical protein